MKPLENVFEKTANTLLSEECKGSRLEIPESLYRRILEFQLQYRSLYRLRITREKVVLLMVAEGCDRLAEKINEVEAAIESLEG